LIGAKQFVGYFRGIATAVTETLFWFATRHCTTTYPQGCQKVAKQTLAASLLLPTMTNVMDPTSTCLNTLWILLFGMWDKSG